MIKTAYVDLSSSLGSSRGYLAEPGYPGNYPGLILVHGIYGMAEQIKGLCRRLATKYYIALAPDLFGGKTAETAEAGQEIRKDITRAAMEQALNASFDFLSKKGRCTGRIACIGYCMGGTLAYRFAINNPKLSAAVVYYGKNPEPLDDVSKIRCPILGSYGEADENIPPSAVHDLEMALKKYGKEYDIKIYPNTPHGFANETKPDYRHLESIDAWVRMMDFLWKHLKA